MINIHKHRGFLIGVAVGALYALIMAAIFTYAPKAEFLSIAILCVMPLTVGVITLFFATEVQARSIKYKIFAPWVSIVGWALVSLILAAETLICVVMLAPLYGLLASLGGLIGGWIRVNYCNKTNAGTVSSFALLPLLLFLVEYQWTQPTEYRTVTTSIDVDASAESVWRGILQVPNISGAEIKWNFTYAIGIPKPQSACIDKVAIGGIRDLRWEKGVHFQERITSLEEYKAFGYDVIVDPASMAIKELDTHVVVGDRYFDVISGSYELSSQDNRTTLTLSTNYRITTKVNAYGIFWANLVLNDFHEAVLGVIKERVEKGKSNKCVQ